MGGDILKLMYKKIALVLCLALGLIAAGIYTSFVNKQKNPLSDPLSSQENKAVLPSETLLEYQDPSGFTFSYPDNLSIVNNDAEDTSTYADLQLSGRQISGSLNLKISDSKFKTLDEWLELNKNAAKGNPKEVKLGNLKAMEIKTSDRLLLGALDQGILFSIEMPLLEQNFWMKVYDKILTSFTFALPENTTSQADAPAGDVIFESEEAVE